MYLANSMEPPKSVSSDFGKLDVMRHLISGEDCAIAGEATAATAAPLAETFKKSRRFIQTSPWTSDGSRISAAFLGRSGLTHRPRGAPAGRFNTEVSLRKRNKAVTGLIT